MSHRRGLTAAVAGGALLLAIAFDASAFVGPNGGIGTASRSTQGGARAEKLRVVVLGLRRPEKGLARFVTSASTPGSGAYGRYLTLGRLRRRYGATRKVRNRVMGYLRREQGSRSVTMGSTGSVVMSVLTESAARRSFCARGPRPPTRGLCIPHRLRGSVRQLVAGEVYSARRSSPRSAARASATSGTPSGCGAALESGAFTPNQVASAYDAAPLAAAGLDGDRVRVATMSPAQVAPGPIRAWARCFGLPAPRFHQSAMPGGGPDTSTAPEETYLDAEALAAIAPGLERITAITVPQDLSFQASFALFMLGALDPARQGGHLPDILSISDGVCESEASRGERSIGQHLLRAAAALGITTLASSGDLGFLGCQSGSGASWPAGSRYVTAVGGTDITLDLQNVLTDQVVWSTFASEPTSGTGSGGGPSQVWPRPAWQRAPGIGADLQPGGRRTRLTPDLASMASFMPGLAVLGGYGGWTGGGGTSAATPLTAAIVALVLERELSLGRPALGTLDPLLYSFAGGALYDSIFWDVIKGTSSPKPSSKTGNSPAGGSAQTGYDLATGLGSLRAKAFAEAVASSRGGE
jgi:subtilase family serine protease